MPEGLDVALAREEAQREAGTPHLRRALGQRDLVLLFVVAVLNLNTVPPVASGGPVTVWLWVLALLFFFWPQGLAVIELSDRYPNEGGVYLWTKEIFGDFHGFMSGWCYWTNNIFYIPTLLLYVVGISVFIGGPHMQALGNDKVFVSVTAVLLLVVMTGINILGLGVGKWVNNLGGIGSVVTAVVLVGLAIAVSQAHGSSLHASDFRVTGVDYHLVSSFGVVCFALVGLELASVMGDEIREPRRTVPGAVVWGGVISGVLYVGATIAVLLALPAKDIGAVQGIIEAVTHMSNAISIGWLVPPIALLLTLAIAGTTSAWLAGSARIPFVAGLDNYLPAGLGKLHPRFATPYVALIVQGVVSCAVLAMSFMGSTVEQGYKVLLLLAVVLQLIPYLYIFLALIRLSVRPDFVRARYSQTTLLAAGLSGLVVTALGVVLAFVPPVSSEPATRFEMKMIGGTVFFLLMAAFFFFVYSRRPAAVRRVRGTTTAES
ncbi:MAG: APC family permease [Gemmatimonadales bacterium]